MERTVYVVMVLVCLFVFGMTRQVLAQTLVVERKSKVHRLYTPVEVAGEELGVYVRYTFVGGAAKLDGAAVIDKNNERVPCDDSRYERALAAYRDLTVTTFAFLTVMGEQIREQRGSRNDLTLLDTEQRAGATERDDGPRRLPTGQPITSGGREIARSHRVVRNEDGSTSVEVLVRPGSCSRPRMMALLRQLAICPDAFIRTGTNHATGTVSTKSYRVDMTAEGYERHRGCFVVSS